MEKKNIFTTCRGIPHYLMPWQVCPSKTSQMLFPVYSFNSWKERGGCNISLQRLLISEALESIASFWFLRFSLKIRIQTVTSFYKFCNRMKTILHNVPRDISFHEFGDLTLRNTWIDFRYVSVFLLNPLNLTVSEILASRDCTLQL